MLWDVGQRDSVAACAAFRSERVYCNVMMPESFAAIAALTPKPRPKAEKPRAQGSDSNRSKIKMRVKRK